ncbi:hypothetical protein FQA39_LY13224 [Lamprigera yunnana]|nr:hypothetical protein FQA39_LY13224 [Lamprigera yunnana]
MLFDSEGSFVQGPRDIVVAACSKGLVLLNATNIWERVRAILAYLFGSYGVGVGGGGGGVVFVGKRAVEDQDVNFQDDVAGGALGTLGRGVEGQLL